MYVTVINYFALKKQTRLTIRQLTRSFHLVLARLLPRKRNGRPPRSDRYLWPCHCDRCRCPHSVQSMTRNSNGVLRVSLGEVGQLSIAAFWQHSVHSIAQLVKLSSSSDPTPHSPNLRIYFFAHFPTFVSCAIIDS